MATFDDLLEKTVDEGRLPGVVLLARDRDGKKTLLISLFYFCFPISSPLSRGEGAWDERSVADQCRIDQVSSLSGKGASPRARGKKRGEKKANQGGKPPFLINRQARLCQGVRAQVDRAGQRPAGTAGHGVPAGVVVQAADDDARPHLPGLARQEILTGFTWYGKPHTRPRAKPITVRHLLTQTAGTGYDFLTIQPIWRYRWWHKEAIGRGERSDQRLGYPLLHEAGEGWTYGSGVTWAGCVLEKVSGMTLEAWIRRYISEPLGLTSLTFFPHESEAVASRLAGVGERDGWSGTVVPFPEPDAPVEDCLGGEGLHASLDDFMAILYSLLVDDEKLLRKETTRMMFTTQQSNTKQPGLRECLGKPVWICNSIHK